ncbi:MAG: TonB family protein, partial [Gammaproteobacteria bacterium]
PDGSVIDAVVVDARPSGWFERAAIDGVKRWRYQPSGRTIQTEVEIEFKLN